MMTKVLTHLPENSRRRKGIICSSERQILGPLYTLPYLILTQYWEKIAVIIPVLYVRKVKGYITCPELYKLQVMELEVKPSFFLIAKPVFILRWDSASLRPRWMVTRSITPHLSDWQKAWTKLCEGLRVCCQLLHQHKSTHMQREQERERLACLSFGTSWLSILDHSVFLGYKKQKATLANLRIKLICFWNSTR